MTDKQTTNFGEILLALDLLDHAALVFVAVMTNSDRVKARKDLRNAAFRLVATCESRISK